MTINQYYSEVVTNVPGVTKIFARGTGAGGAASLTSVKGVTSIAYNAATGNYTVTLPRKFAGLLMVSGVVIDATSADDAQITLSSDLTSNQTFGILVTRAGTAIDLATDEKLLLEITLEDTNTKPAGF